MNIIEQLIHYPSINTCPLCKSSMNYRKSDGYDDRDCTNCNLFCFANMTTWSHNHIGYQIVYYDQVKEENEYRILGYFNEQLILYTTINLQDDKIINMYDEDHNGFTSENLRYQIINIKTLEDLYNIGDLALKMMVFK